MSKPTTEERIDQIIGRIVSQETSTEGGYAEYALKDEDIKYGNPLHNSAELKSDLLALINEERYEELRHIAVGDEDASWLADPDKYEKEGSSPVVEVWERIEQLQTLSQGRKKL